MVLLLLFVIMSVCVLRSASDDAILCLVCVYLYGGFKKVLCVIDLRPAS